MLTDDKYILVGQTPVPEPDLLAWARWFEAADRRVDETFVGDTRISTIFLGLDHRMVGDGPPILFETMTFGDGEGGIMRRCSTWLEAERQHAEVVAEVRAACRP